MVKEGFRRDGVESALLFVAAENAAALKHCGFEVGG